MQRGSELVLGYCGSPFVGTYALNILFVPKLTSYNIAWPIHVCWYLYYPYNDRDLRDDHPDTAALLTTHLYALQAHVTHLLELNVQ